MSSSGPLRILVVGAGGQVGRALASAARTREFRDRVELHTRDRAALDVLDEPAVRDCVAAVRPAATINAAAYTDTTDDDVHRHTVNAVAPFVLARALTAVCSAAPLLVQLSSDAVFGGWAESDGVQLYAPEAPLHPGAGAYARAKAEGEGVARWYPRTLIVRAANVFGPGGGARAKCERQQQPLSAGSFPGHCLAAAARDLVVSAVTRPAQSLTSATSLARALLGYLLRAPRVTRGAAPLHAVHDGVASPAEVALHLGCRVRCVVPTTAPAVFGLRPSPDLPLGDWRTALTAFRVAHRAATT